MRRSLPALFLCCSLGTALAAPRPAAREPPRARVAVRRALPAKASGKAGRAVAALSRKVLAKSRGPAPKPPPPATTTPRDAVDPSSPHEQRIQVLRERLEAALRDSPLRRSRVGVEVRTASDGDVLYAHNADRLFNPASNTKILTTAAALTLLGGDYRYPTTLHGPLPDPEGVVHGDVELRGSGDPSLSSADLADLARSVSDLGITRIEGAILASGKFRDPAHPDVPVGEHALILNRNTYGVRVRPTEPGRPAVVDVQPYLSDYFTVENGVTTVANKRTRLQFDMRRDSADRMVVIVKGRVNPRRDAVVRRRLSDGSLFAAATLRGALIDFGVSIAGGIRQGGLSGDAPVLGEHASSPLAEICRISNKDSNNFVADTIFKTMGGELFGVPGTLAKGIRAVDRLLEPLGVERSAYTIVNGSGLTHANRLQPTALTRLLRHLYFDLSVAPEFLSSLAVGGIDGTIRNRFRGTDAVGLVRAKTGTLSGVSALSGYVGDDGEVLIFSIFVEGFRHRALHAVRQAQVRMVQSMLGYLRADRPRPRPADPDPAIPGAPLDDSESDGDLVGGE
ncbi:MAG: D-alanyl-D-alanine carboxypeptidase/D-alanyl-D-alanine-endopeptidase [Myxococcales bacterium]|nr:D-alanyl-D-alanine carboxypeptidase/D-alanyl-D-alanine-endopeptidase [Myxococcales bacterium]